MATIIGAFGALYVFIRVAEWLLFKFSRGKVNGILLPSAIALGVVLFVTGFKFYLL